MEILRSVFSRSRALELTSSLAVLALCFCFLEEDELRQLLDDRREAYSGEFRQRLARATFLSKKAVLVNRSQPRTARSRGRRTARSRGSQPDCSLTFCDRSANKLPPVPTFSGSWPRMPGNWKLLSVGLPRTQYVY